MRRRRIKRQKTELDEILARHAEDLREGRDTTEELIREHGEVFPALEGLLRVAQRAYSTLVPVEPEAAFAADLKQRLIAEQRQRQARSAVRWTERRQRAGRVSRLLGLAVSMLAVATMVVQIMGSILMLIALMVRRRRRSSAAA
jgi:hypothetical protein